MRTLSNRNDKTLLVATFIIGLYIMYNVFLVPIGYYIPRLSMALLFVSGCLTLVSKNIRVPKEYWVLIIFATYAFASGIIVAYNLDTVVRQSLFLMESVIAGIIIFNVSKDTKSLSVLTGLFALGALLTVLYILRHPDLLMMTRLSLNEGFNSNTLGVMLMYGIWSIIFTLNYKQPSIIKIVITLVLTLVIFYLLIQTGSRKSTLGSMLILGVYVIYILIVNGGKRGKAFNHILLSFAIFGFLIFIYYRYINSFLEASETFQSRMETVDDSGVTRWEIINSSLNVWSDHPILGVGLDNIRYYTETRQYSHNSYVEILGCTGIVGAALFFVIYWHMISFVFMNIKKFKALLINPSVFYMCLLILVFLIVCFVQINIYNQTHMFITYFILSFISLYNNSDEKSTSVI